jgi:protein gp37
VSDNTGIEWADATWNPVTGCTKVSEGCDHCYAETFAERFRGVEGHHFERGFDVTLRPERLEQPMRWKKPRRIFVNSMSDLFHDAIPDDYIAKVFAVMAAAPQHTFQVLTKRHGRMRSLLSSYDFRELVFTATNLDTGETHGDRWPLPNVWLGVSVENQHWADIRIPKLLDTPAAVRFLSCEPLLGPIDLIGQGGNTVGAGVYALPDPPDRADGELEPFCQNHGVPNCNQGCRFVDWVIVGGESGPGARPMHPDWARTLRDQCTAAGVRFLFKQAGSVLAREWGCKSRKGTDPAEWPEPFPREYPA